MVNATHLCEPVSAYQLVQIRMPQGTNSTIVFKASIDILVFISRKKGNLTS